MQLKFATFDKGLGFGSLTVQFASPGAESLLFTREQEPAARALHEAIQAALDGRST